ncbi:M48 family metalloprotease [bacterium]|nr:M48 family metalloprotease [bacterium]
MSKKLNYYIVGLFLIISLFLTGCATVYNPVTNREENTLIGEKEEIRIGKKATVSLEKQHGLVKDAQLNAHLNNIGQKVARKSGRPHLPYTFKILKIKEVNALALPGGYIYVTEGLLKEAQNDAQIACVLGHEIGHVNARHAIKRVESQLGYSLIYTILLGKSEKDIQNLANLTFNLTSLGYSRSDEFQADELGIKYAYKAGYDPYGMVQFLKILKEQYKKTPSQIDVFFSTHPHVDDRIERAEKIAGKYAKGQG